MTKIIIKIFGKNPNKGGMPLILSKLKNLVNVGIFVFFNFSIIKIINILM
jgi:hypothetical protein